MSKTASKRSKSAAKKKPKTPHTAPKVVRTWRLSPYFPNGQNVKIVFFGLALFSYKQTPGQAQVAFHRDSSDHTLEIEVYKNCKPVWKQTVPKDRMKFEIGITGKNEDVAFYYAGSPDKFDREIHPDPNDFRWLPDLESDDSFAFKKKIDKKQSFFKTKLYVRNGTFYTVGRTNSKFLAGAGGPKMGRFPRGVVAGLQLNPGECLSFTLNEKPYLPFSICANSGDSYEIYFRNECGQPENECKYPDFNLVFDALKNISGFNVQLDGPPGPTGSINGLCVVHARGSDPRPCMGAGFGQDDGFPDAPNP